jgi:hypothetical protein
MPPSLDHFLRDPCCIGHRVLVRRQRQSEFASQLLFRSHALSFSGGCPFSFGGSGTPAIPFAIIVITEDIPHAKFSMTYVRIALNQDQDPHPLRATHRKLQPSNKNRQQASLIPSLSHTTLRQSRLFVGHCHWSSQRSGHQPCCESSLPRAHSLPL